MTGPGRFIAVVGPSGVGKDSVISGLCAAVPGLLRARRVVTRDPDAGGEDCETVTVGEFARRRAAGDFIMSWEAHGMHYGIPVTVRDEVAAGRDVIANLSRTALSDAAMRLPRLIVLHLTAAHETLVARLDTRGRESAAAIAARLARDGGAIPDGLGAINVANDGSLGDAIAAAARALYPVNA